MNLIMLSGSSNCVNTQYAALSGAMFLILALEAILFCNVTVKSAMGKDIMRNILVGNYFEFEPASSSEGKCPENIFLY